MRLRILGGALALALGWAYAAGADTLVVPVESVTVIDNGEGAYRALLRLGPIEGLEEMSISRAYLVMSTARRGADTVPLELQVHPISREWTAGTVTWTGGWSRPGGDFHDEIYARATMAPSRLGEELRIDVEAIMRDVRHGMRFYGFVVTALPYKRLGLRSDELLRVPGLAQARLVVEYEPAPRVRVRDVR